MNCTDAPIALGLLLTVDGQALRDLKGHILGNSTGDAARL